MAGSPQIASITRLEWFSTAAATFTRPTAKTAGCCTTRRAAPLLRGYTGGGDLAASSANNGGVSANSLSVPGRVVLDSGGNLYVTGVVNDRVLYYPAGSTTATRVYGQGGSFTSSSANNGGISANSLYNPDGLALDGGGNLYVADLLNNRVLYYPAGSTTATRCLRENMAASPRMRPTMPG